MSQGGVKVTRQEWLETLFRYLLPCPEGVELSQLGNEFEPAKPIPPGERLSTTLSIRNDRDVDVSIERTEWFQQHSHLFSITDKLPLIVPVGSTVELTVVYSSTSVGIHQNKCILYIAGCQFMRGCTASSATALAEHLQPSEPYTRRERRRRVQRRNVKTRGDRPPSKGGMPFTVKLTNHPIPRGFADRIAGGELQEALRDLRTSLWQGETVLNRVQYAELFSKLLYAEELARRQELESYGLDNVLFTKEGHLYVIDVPGLSENRPSVQVGDSVEVSLATVPESLHEGFVYAVEQTTIKVRFHHSFHRLWTASALFTVDFRFKRTLYNIMHDTLCRIAAATDDRGDVYRSILLPRHDEAHDMDVLASQLDSLRLLLEDDEQEEKEPQWQWLNDRLNAEQRLAVRQMAMPSPMPQGESPRPFVLFGPPGTGKTSTLVEAIGQLLRLRHQRRAAHVLVCAPSNAAADEIVKRLAATNVSDADLFRLHAYSRRVEDVDPLSRYRVVVTTCATAAKLFYQGMPSTHFTHVIIDECGHCMEPEALSSFIHLASAATRLIVAGDPEQLGPVIQSSVATHAGLAMSLLERYTSMVPLYRRHHEDGQYTETLGYNPAYIVKLVRCYRCHPEIIRVPNRRFYLDQLIPSAPVDVSHSLLHWPQLPNPTFPLLFHRCNGENLQEAHSPSWFNIAEVETVLDYVRALHAFGIRHADIGIITPYRQQVKKIRQALALEASSSASSASAASASLASAASASSAASEVLVGSCEQFQGQERQVIIISTVRSSPELLEQDALFNLGFVGDRKRFNVAVTRAQALLIVVGSPRVLCGDEHWKALYEHCQANGACVGDVTWSGPEEVEDRVEELFGGVEEEKGEAASSSSSPVVVDKESDIKPRPPPEPKPVSPPTPTPRPAPSPAASITEPSDSPSCV
eukprot:gene16133-11537_t